MSNQRSLKLISFVSALRLRKLVVCFCSKLIKLLLVQLIYCQEPIPPPPVSPIDNQVMLDFTSSLVNQPSGWGTLHPEYGACGWGGVTCEVVGEFTRVTGISISMKGAIPSSIGNMEELHLLALSAIDSNTIISLPPSLLTMSQLRFLSLNGFQGTIPNAIGQLVNLQDLYWVSDQLSGTIPSTIGQLVNLQRVHIQGNQLSGAIPSTIGQLVNLQRLNIQGNQLSGAIPSMGNAGLKMLYLKGVFDGTIPSSLFTLGALEELYLYSFQLTGNIHDIGGLKQLQKIFIRGNIEGTIPDSIGLLINLREFDIRQQKLSGTLPASIGNLVNLQKFIAFFNELSGTIPASIGNWINATVVHLSNNKLQGDIPPGLVLLPKLTQLHLDGNQLSGDLSTISRLGIECYMDSNNCVLCPAQCGCTNQLCDPCNRNVPENFQKKAAVLAAAAYDRSLLEPIADKVSVIEDGNNYLLLKDMCLQTIVLSLRGTSFATAEDALTDLMTDLSISGSPVGDGIFIHSGFLQRARQLQPVVERAYIYAEDAAFQDIHIVGHSLAGAVSTVLAHLYQNTPRTQITAYGFGMPPAISGTVQSYGFSYPIGFINRYDIVPRLTVQSILQVIDDCKLGKIAKFLAKPSPAVRFALWAARQLFDIPLEMSGIKYHHVGTIWYYNETSSFVAVEDVTQFDKIVISSTMISDHYMASYLDAVRGVPHTEAPGDVLAFTCPPSLTPLAQLIFDISDLVGNWFKRSISQTGSSSKLIPWFRNGMVIQREDVLMFIDSLSDIDRNRAVTQASVLGVNLEAQLHCILWSNLTLTVIDSITYQPLAEGDMSGLLSATNITFLHPILGSNTSRSGFIIITADFAQGSLHNIQLLGDEQTSASIPVGANGQINSAVFLPSSSDYPTILASTGSNFVISCHTQIEAAAPIQITLDEVVTITSIAVAKLDTPRTLVLVLDGSAHQVLAYEPEWNEDLLMGLRCISRMNVTLPAVSMVSNQAGTMIFFLLENHSQIEFSFNNMTLEIVLENNRAVQGLEPTGLVPNINSPTDTTAPNSLPPSYNSAPATAPISLPPSYNSAPATAPISLPPSYNSAPATAPTTPVTTPTTANQPNTKVSTGPTIHRVLSAAVAIAVCLW